MLLVIAFFLHGTGMKDKKDDLLKAIQEAQKSKRGIWSLGEQRVSAAEQKRTNVEVKSMNIS